MGWVFDRVGHVIAQYLEKPVQGYEPFTPSAPQSLRGSLKPGDVLLVEGNNHISGVIKYLTQSTWSHAALYVGPIAGHETDGEPHVLIEAKIGTGVVTAPLSKYFPFHTRVCRPIGLAAEDCERVCAYACERIGLAYDLKNITDLLRYLVPASDPAALAAPHDRARLRRSDQDHLLGADRAGVPSRCATRSWPRRRRRRAARRAAKSSRSATTRSMRRATSTSRPYFSVVKPTIEDGFDYKKLHWADLPLPPDDDEAEEMRAEPAVTLVPQAGADVQGEKLATAA